MVFVSVSLIATLFLCFLFYVDKRISADVLVGETVSSGARTISGIVLVILVIIIRKSVSIKLNVFCLVHIEYSSHSSASCAL